MSAYEWTVLVVLAWIAWCASRLVDDVRAIKPHHMTRFHFVDEGRRYPRFRSKRPNRRSQHDITMTDEPKLTHWDGKGNAFMLYEDGELRIQTAKRRYKMPLEWWVSSAILVEDVEHAMPYLTETRKLLGATDDETIVDAAKRVTNCLSDGMRWIPVSERLPEDGQQILAFWPSGIWTGGMESLRYRAADAPDGPARWIDAFDNFADEPSHWMPLPEGPK